MAKVTKVTTVFPDTSGLCLFCSFHDSARLYDSIDICTLATSDTSGAQTDVHTVQHVWNLPTVSGNLV